MCCGQKVHYDAMAILREQIAKSMVQRPVINQTHPETLKQRIFPKKEINKQKSVRNTK